MTKQKDFDSETLFNLIGENKQQGNRRMSASFQRLYTSTLCEHNKDEMKARGEEVGPKHALTDY